jgi:hypothetical protein
MVRLLKRTGFGSLPFAIHLLIVAMETLRRLATCSLVSKCSISLGLEGGVLLCTFFAMFFGFTPWLTVCQRQCQRDKVPN